MYPCDFDAPLPIAIRTQQYFKACGLDRRPAARLTRRPPDHATTPHGQEGHDP